MPTVAAPWKPPATLIPAVYFDLFPTTVTFPVSGTVYDKTRIILTAPPSPRLYVFQDGPHGPGAVVIAEYDPTFIYGNVKQGFDIVLTAPNPSPIHVQLRPMHNCGCGSQLKNFTPFSTMRHTQAPTALGSINDFPGLVGYTTHTPAP